jgi:chromatin remodeling complex protein RSC6
MASVEQVTQVEVEAGVEVVEQNFDDLFSSMCDQISETSSTLRTLKANMKVLEKIHRKELKSVKKHKRASNGAVSSKKPSGFNKPCAVPQSIIDLLKLSADEELPRTQVTKLIYGYIKEHNLQVPEDKRTINPNKELKTLFKLGKNEQISFYNIQTHIKKLYPVKVTDANVVVAAAAVADTTVSEVEAVVETKKTKGKGKKNKAVVAKAD